MGIITGALGLQDSDRDFVNNVGQGVVYTATQDYLNRWNDLLRSMTSVFVAGYTSDHKTKYVLPNGGRLQRRGRMSRPATTKTTGEWNIALPLEDFGDVIAADDVSLAYLTVQRWDKEIKGITIRGAGTMRQEILRRIFQPTAQSFEDELHGTLTVDPIANGDAVTYPPVIGSETNATHNHFVATNYAASAISDANNPLDIAVPHLTEHFGTQRGGSNIVTYINSAQATKFKGLADFEAVPDRFVRMGDQVNIPVNLPSVPGNIIGRSNGSWISVWDDGIPAGYTHSHNLDEEPPIQIREDPGEVGLGRGLRMVAKDEDFPFESYIWRWRFGTGPANRLNGVTIQIVASSTYTAPAGY
jgi:hypothetical protein